MTIDKCVDGTLYTQNEWVYIKTSTIVEGQRVHLMVSIYPKVGALWVGGQWKIYDGPPIQLEN